MFEKVQRWLRFNLFYLGRPPWDTGISPPELITYLQSPIPGRALDVGCGTGTNLKTMAERGWDVVGVDIAWLSVLRARSKLRQAGLVGRVINGDITGEIALATPFDFVLDIGCYHSLSPTGREKYRQHLHNWLKGGGTYLIYAHRKTAPGGPHGISEEDVIAFDAFLDLRWRDDGQEKRPERGGGRPASWMQWDK